MPQVSAATSVPRAATAVDVPVASDEVADLPEPQNRAAELQGFEGKVGQTLVLPSPNGDPMKVLVGLGTRANLTVGSLRLAAAAYARAVARHRTVATNLAAELGDDQRDEAIAAVVDGVRLTSYRYTAYKEATAMDLRRVAVLAKGRGVKAQVERASTVTAAVLLARDLSNEPGGSLTPSAFADKAAELGKEAGLKVTVWDEKRITRERLGGLLAVNQGSVNPARFVQLGYRPPGQTKPKATVALVGKGITFDSGGLSLKTSIGMATMKVDMAGGAVVLAAMTALAALKPSVPITVNGYIPLTDNMTGGDAQRPGDVFTARNGKTIEVLNTDAEGRLVLADALALAAESEPDAIIDVATLTGSASAALGTGYAALMATDDQIAQRLEGASRRTGENIWRMPLPEEYRSQLDSTVADLKNIGSGPYGGALVAGLFLREFVGEVPWAHLDLGFAAMSDVNRGILVKGATGFGVRLLVDALAGWADTAS